MKELELYDTVTLNGKDDYYILGKTKYFKKTYYLILPINSEGNSNMSDFKIVKQEKINGKIWFEEETNKERTKKLSEIFANILQKEVLN